MGQSKNSRAAGEPRKSAHDHAPCLESALRRAETAFADRGLRLTDLRRRVFAEIAASHDAVGAYDLLDRLSRQSGERLAPVTVYRALDTLLDAGVVHRLESRNAFFACHAPHTDRNPHIALMCEVCAGVQEADAGAAIVAVASAAAAAGFSPKSTVIEVSGRCAGCSRSTTEPA